MKKTSLSLAVASVLMAGSVGAWAQSISGSVTADNSFAVYLSADNSVLGTLIFASPAWSDVGQIHTDWPSSEALPSTLLGSNTFVHIVVNNGAPNGNANPTGLLASLTLSGATWAANSAAVLTTGSAGWTVAFDNAGSLDAWQTPTVAANTVTTLPWGAVVPAIAGASWINHGSAGSDLGSCAGLACNTYYSAQISAPIPEPETYAMMIAGLGMLGFMARRRKSN